MVPELMGYEEMIEIVYLRGWDPGRSIYPRPLVYKGLDVSIVYRNLFLTHVYPLLSPAGIV